MQGLMLAALLFLIVPFGAGATEAPHDEAVFFGGSVSLGGGYESDMARAQGILGRKRRAGDLLAAVSGDMTLFEETTIGAAVLYDVVPAFDGRYSRLVFDATLDWYRDLGPVELDLGVAGSFSLVDRFAPEPYFGSFDAYADVVIPHGEEIEWVVTLSGGYQHGLREDVRYLRGPDLFLQGAVRWHFFAERGLLVGGYRAGVSLRKEAGLYDIAGLPERGYTALSACNEHFEQALFGKISAEMGMVTLVGRFSAIHRYAFVKDVWTTLSERKEKRHIDLVAAPSAEARFALTDEADLSVQYDFEYTVSSLDRDDYYDMNGPRHTVKALVTQRF